MDCFPLSKTNALRKALGRKQQPGQEGWELTWGADFSPSCLVSSCGIASVVGKTDLSCQLSRLPRRPAWASTTLSGGFPTVGFHKLNTARRPSCTARETAPTFHLSKWLRQQTLPCVHPNEFPTCGSFKNAEPEFCEHTLTGSDDGT